MLFPLDIIPPLPLLHFIEIDLDRVFPPFLSCYGLLRLKHLCLEFHLSRLVTFGLDHFRLHVEDPRLLEDR